VALERDLSAGIAVRSAARSGVAGVFASELAERVFLTPRLLILIYNPHESESRTKCTGNIGGANRGVEP
jgi:hypothetical protein